MANNNWNNYTEKTATPVDADEVMVRDSADGKNKKLLFGTFWKWVAKKLNEATISELQTSNKTIVGALNQLNSESSILSNLLIYRTSGANIKSITISVNKDANKAFRYAPFIIFGDYSFLTGVTCSINSTNKVGDILAEYSFDDASEKVTFSNLKTFANMVIIIYYPNISKAEIKENNE